MADWDKVKGINKITDILGETIGFHDSSLMTVKYCDHSCTIKIDCEGFFKTMYNLYDKYSEYQNLYVTISFKNITLFELDYNCEDNLIDEIEIGNEGEHFEVTIYGYELKIICGEVEIDNVEVIYRQSDKQKKMLGKLLKSDI